MKRYLLPARVRVEKNVITHVTRVLRGKGILNVSVGQQVSPEDIIGNAEVSSGFRTINLSTLLSVNPLEVESYLTKQIGQRIYQGELLASKKSGLFTGKKMVTAPTDGILDFLNTKTGELKISFFPRKVDLPSGVYGIVDIVDHERNQVLIRTQVSRIYGICGSGRSRDGILSTLGRQDDLVSKSMIDTKYEGQVLVGGSLFFKETISNAISSGVSGIITGGINAGDYRGIGGGRLIFPKKIDNDIGISVVVCEGFGSIPLGDDIFGLLQGYEGKFVFIDGNKALINLPASESSSLTKVKNTKLPQIQPVNDILQNYGGERVAELNIGMNVRIIGSPYVGQQGKLLAVDESATLLPSGVKACLATVETTRKKVQVPVANLEIMM